VRVLGLHVARIHSHTHTFCHAICPSVRLSSLFFSCSSRFLLIHPHLVNSHYPFFRFFQVLAEQLASELGERVVAYHAGIILGLVLCPFCTCLCHLKCIV